MVGSSAVMRKSLANSDCVVVGDVFFDIAIRLDEINPSFPVGGTYYCRSIAMFEGGSGNVAAALATLGVRTVFVGKAGKDMLGEAYKKNLESYGVEPHISFDDQLPTGITVTSISPNGERSFIVARGANDMLQVSEIEEVRPAIQQASYVYVTGYSLVNAPQRDAVIRVARIAREFNTKVVFDPGAFNIIPDRRDCFRKLIELTDVLCLNAAEAIALAQVDNSNDAANRLSREAPVVIVKLGSEGCVILKENDVSLRIPSYKVECVDTTGAGDAFVAAVIFGLLQNFPLRSLGQFANWFAAETVKSLGARSFPSQEEADFFLGKSH